MSVDEERERERERITNRQIAMLLSQYDEINAPQVVKDAAKKQFWFLSNDLKLLYNTNTGDCDADTIR